MNASSWRPSLTSVCAIASIIAVSVLGRIGIQRAPTKSGMSDLSGLIETNSTPASLAWRNQDSSVCRPAPPDVTWAFFTAIPPKAIISLVCLMIEGQSVTLPVTGPSEPMMRGSRK